MSDVENNKKPRRPIKNLPPERFQPKVLFIWLAIFAAVVALLVWSPGITTSPAKLTIQEVIERAEAGEVAKGTISPDSSGGRDWVSIKGELVESQKLKGERGVETNQFVAAGRLTDANMERLQKSKKFAEQQSQTLLSAILVQVIPFLLIIGLLYFLFVRQLKQAGRGAMSFGKSRAKLLTRDRD